MSDPSEELHRAGTGAAGSAWRRIPRVGAPGVVKQAHPLACGPACGEMLLRDRGLVGDQAALMDRHPGPFSEADLAIRLTTVAGVKFRGGALDVADETGLRDVELLTETRGTWAALLLPGSPRAVGHWVVVDGLAQGGVVLVRDPVGIAYGMLADDFLHLWRYAVHVAQESPR